MSWTGITTVSILPHGPAVIPGKPAKLAAHRCPDRSGGLDVSGESRAAGPHTGNRRTDHEVHDLAVRLTAGLRRAGRPGDGGPARLDRGGLRGPGSVHGVVHPGSG